MFAILTIDSGALVNIAVVNVARSTALASLRQLNDNAPSVTKHDAMKHAFILVETAWYLK